MYWAITGHTEAEIIKERANAIKPHMGLTTWENAPEGTVLKTDVSVAKNYLSEKELKDLNRIVTMYLDFAELQAERQNAMKMSGWVSKLNGLLQFKNYKVLQDAGKTSATIARQLAKQEYQKFRIEREKALSQTLIRRSRKLRKEDKLNDAVLFLTKGSFQPMPSPLPAVSVVSGGRGVLWQKWAHFYRAGQTQLQLT